MAAWQPILSGAEALRAEAALDAIAEDLARRPAPPAGDRYGASLATGEAGLALFFAYLDRARPGAGWIDLAAERLERAVDRMGSTSQLPGLYQGFSGIAWAVEHLRDREDHDDPDDPNEEIDPLLREQLGKTRWREGYDLISGLAGLGIYALERLPGPAAADCLVRICELLADLAAPREPGFAWPTAWELMSPGERKEHPEGMINLGVAHGVPGVLPVLARAVAAGAAPEPARDLLRGAVGWILSQKHTAGGESVFPRSIGAEGAAGTPAPSRAAWCYGDPGIAASLLVAARAAGEPAWEAEALDLARTAARRPLGQSGVLDAGLCHGAAGLAHLFNRLYQATGDSGLLAAARRWWVQALDLRQPGRGVGGFLSWGPDTSGEMSWRDDPGVLTGAAGVALALLAATTDVEPAWDRFLLLSPLPPRDKGPKP